MFLFLIILLTAAVTLFLTFVGINLTSVEKRVQHRLECEYGVGDPQFERSAAHLLGGTLTHGNSIVSLVNGCKYFPAMLEAISDAQKTITFESFIFLSGEVGNKFSNALIERSRAGVKVHILIDWIGSWGMRDKHIKELCDAGCHVEAYRKFSIYNLTQFNNRTHRKILVIDGKIAFTGGAGIADAWDGDAEDTTCWRDNQFQVTGPAVAEMQSTFMDNWMQTHAEVLHDQKYFPELEETGSAKLQVFKSGPSEGLESARLMVLMSVGCAKKTIRIASPYFIPDNLIVDSLVQARKRGVEVEIILPGVIDAKIASWASRARWGPLLTSGCQIYLYQGALYHCKLFLVDDLWSSVGSSNFDTRSFRLNDEMNVNTLDADFAAELTATFKVDKARCRKLTLEEWNQRPTTTKLLDKACALLRSQL